MLKVSNLVTTYLYHPTINSTWKKKFLMFAQGVGGAKTEVIKVGGVTLMHFLRACRLSHLIFVKMNLFPSNIRDLWYAIHTR